MGVGEGMRESTAGDVKPPPAPFFCFLFGCFWGLIAGGCVLVCVLLRQTLSLFFQVELSLDESLIAQNRDRWTTLVMELQDLELVNGKLLRPPGILDLGLISPFSPAICARCDYPRAQGACASRHWPCCTVALAMLHCCNVAMLIGRCPHDSPA